MAYMRYVAAKHTADAVQDSADFPGEKKPDTAADTPAADKAAADTAADKSLAADTAADKSLAAVVDSVVASLDFLEKSPEKRERCAHTKKNLVLVPEWMTPPSMLGVIQVDMTAKQMYRLHHYVAAVNRGLEDAWAAVGAPCPVVLNLQAHAMYQRWSTILSFFEDLLKRAHVKAKNAQAGGRTPSPDSMHTAGLAICGWCRDFKLGTMMCSRCRSAYYCNAECQKKDWPSHKACCM